MLEAVVQVYTVCCVLDQKMTEEKTITASTSSSNMSSTTDDSLGPIPREKWARKMDFILSVAGGFVGLGNVWRFPYLCYKNGGGAFLIPYSIFLVLGGIPIFFLEVSLGQYMSEGGVTSWRLVPIGTGIGYASMVIVALLNIYYIVILAWAIFYLFQSFTTDTLPWAKCDPSWPCCLTNHSAMNDSLTYNWTECKGDSTTPENDYWQKRVLGLSSGIDDVGGLRWELVGCLALAWLICYFCIWKGVKSTGKVVYFTATFPFLMLLVFLVRGVTLPGAMTGIEFYLKPNMTKLTEPEVWVDAGTQIFFSFAICLGALVSLGSYNKFNNNCYKDCVVLSLLNSGTSFISGFAIFSVLGFMAEQQNKDISEVAESGPGLAFIAYPKAITMMPCPTLWAILFFIMILLLGLDSQFVETEGFITSIVDLFPGTLRRGYNRELFIAATCFCSFLVGLTMVTNGGMYVFQLFDFYGASGMCLLWVAFFEAGCIAWVFGAERMWKNITRMIGYRPLPLMKYIWIFGTPLLTLFTFAFFLIGFKPLVYNKTYTYPSWGTGLGIMLAVSSMSLIPLHALYSFLTTPGTWSERWTYLTTPQLRSNHPDFQSKYDRREKPSYLTIFGSETPDSSDENGIVLKVINSKKGYEEEGVSEERESLSPPNYETAVGCSEHTDPESSKLMA